MSRPIPPPKVWPDVAEETASRRLWAAWMLTSDIGVCRSILLGRPVLAHQLDAEALRRAMRGEPLPHLAATSASGQGISMPSPRAVPSR